MYYFQNIFNYAFFFYFQMWRFIEEGPLLKFPLRESPFMSADPMYRDVVVAPPIRYQRPILIQNPDNIVQSHTYSPKQSIQSASRVELTQEINSLPSIQPKTQQVQNSPNSFSYSGSNVL